MTSRSKRIAVGAVAALALVGFLAACSSKADTVSYNLSQDAEEFNIERRITILHGVTGEVTFEVEGRCSVESADSFLEEALEITCKIGPDEYAKHFQIIGANGQASIQQLDTVDSSVYHHRVIIKPETLLPEFDYDAGDQ